MEAVWKLGDDEELRVLVNLVENLRGGASDTDGMWSCAEDVLYSCAKIRSGGVSFRHPRWCDRESDQLYHVTFGDLFEYRGHE